MKEISDSSSHICIETVRAYREDLLTKEDTLKIIMSVIFDNMPWQKGEELLFEKASDLSELDKCLRNYKMDREKITISCHDLFRKENSLL